MLSHVSKHLFAPPDSTQAQSRILGTFSIVYTFQVLIDFFFLLESSIGNLKTAKAPTCSSLTASLTFYMTKKYSRICQLQEDSKGIDSVNVQQTRGLASCISSN